MTFDPIKLAAFGEAINTLAAEHCESDYETFLLMQGALARLDAASETHPAIVATLEAMAELLDAAAFNFYASFK